MFVRIYPENDFDPVPPENGDHSERKRAAGKGSLETEQRPSGSASHGAPLLDYRQVI